jgi:hypothetical protein
MPINWSSRAKATEEEKNSKGKERDRIDYVEFDMLKNQG